MFCLSQAYPTEHKPEKKQIYLAFSFPKKRKVFNKSQNFEIWLQESQIGNPAIQEMRMRIRNARKISTFC